MQKLKLDFVNQCIGKLLLRKLVRQTLSRSFLMELCSNISNSYPTFCDFLENCNELIVQLTVQKSSGVGVARECQPTALGKHGKSSSSSTGDSSSKSQIFSSTNKLGTVLRIKILTPPRHLLEVNILFSKS